ncbi:unnamed protein product [Cuscuta epithymum]|uniref:Cystatin domain-containing protein n=1 Tax=Cuscuta epithymum TaxID=186058 RepID=A0AAV0C136_9ASTE|nr:unnamed protein product [Cuscuta epithymum]
MIKYADPHVINIHSQAEIGNIKSQLTKLLGFYVWSSSMEMPNTDFIGGEKTFNFSNFDPSSLEGKTSDDSNHSTISSEEIPPVSHETLGSDGDDDAESFNSEDYAGSRSEYESEEAWKETKVYIRRLVESQGFDVPPVPDGIQFGAVYPLYTEEALEEDSEEDSEEDPEEDSDDEDQYPSHYSSVKDYTSMAIDQYNADNNAKLELVRIKKVNYGLCCGYNYYITILAKDTISGEVKTLQAKAYHCIFKADRSLTFVRLAPGQQ